MDFPRVSDILGGRGSASDPAPPTVGGEAGDADAEQVELPSGAQVAVSAPDGTDVDPEAVQRGLDDDVAEQAVLVHGQSNDGDSMTVTPIADAETNRLGGRFDELFNDFNQITDEKIQKLRDNRVDYNETIGKWILTEDDRVPAILNQQVGLILGQDGLEVEPKDPDNDADVRLAEHMKDLYSGNLDDEPHVEPNDVVRRIVAQNYMAARSVVRAVDLAELPLESLTYYRDPEDSTEYYLQDSLTYKKLHVQDDNDWETTREHADEQVLELGTHVFDAELFRTKPLRGIADLVVNKMVIQRLMARKAEIASVGGLYITVSPPDWLDESQYQDQVEDPDADDETITKLELHMREGISDAFNTLQDYQSGFIMSIPSHWEVNQIEVPETGEPMADQIRAYNKSIAARLLFPIDLMELREGAELSRDTLFRTLLNVIAGWRSEILTVFDNFARVQKDIHNLDGDINHTLPKLEAEDEKLIISALQNAGLAGMTTKEVRQALNRIEGFDLDTERDEADQKPLDDAPPVGGPQDGEEREQSMVDILEEEDGEADDGGPSPEEPGKGQPAAAQDVFTPPEGLDLHELDGWDQTSVWRAFLSLGAQHRTCSKRMATEVRNADAWCAALKDQALGTDLWRVGQGADPAELQGSLAAESVTREFSGSLRDFADAVHETLEANMDGEITELRAEDDFVAFSPGGVDPTEEDPDGEFNPIVVVKAGDNEYTVQNASDDDLSGLDDVVAQAMAPGAPFDTPDDVSRMSTDELVAELAAGD